MSRAARLAQALAGTLVAAVVIVGTASAASAHADLVRSDPPTGSTFEQAPHQVTLFFSEPVDPVFTRVTVRGTNDFSTAPKALAVGPNNALIVELPDLAAGPYAITYTTTTSDGHTAAGDVVLGVGRGAQLSSLGPTDPAGTGAGLRTAATAARLIWYVGLALLAGALVWSWLLPAATPSSDGRDIVVRRTRRALIVGWRVLAVATVGRIGLLVASLASAAPSSSLATIVDRLRPTTAGRAWFVVLDLVVVAGVLVRRDARRALAVFTAALAIAEAATGHAAVGPHPRATTAAVALHLLALATWGGGLLLLAALVVSPAWRAIPAYRRQAVLNQFLRRFSRLALVAVATLAATGGLLAWVQLGGLHALTASGYGHVLLVKLAIIAVVLSLGGWHWFAGPGRERWWRVQRRARATFSVTTAIEAAAMVVVVLVASVLASRTPGRVSTSSTALAASSRPTRPDVCRKAPIETSECWQRYLTYVVDKKGPAAAIGAVRDASKVSTVALSECHQLVHTVGRRTFDDLKSAPAALKFSTSLCNSGFQHGVIEEAIARLTDDELRKELPTFCQPGIAYRRYSFDHHNCAHGIGHGIATQKREDVFAAAPFCDVLGDPWEVQSCYGGVFMQKVIGDINGASTDAHQDDPVWPCDVVPEIQKDSCYLISTGRVLRLVSYDWPKAFAVCDGVEAAHTVTCYESMGRDIAGFTNFEPVPSRDLCMKAGRLGPEACFRGTVETMIDNDHNAVHATQLCAAVPAEFSAGCLKTRDAAMAQL